MRHNCIAVPSDGSSGKVVDPGSSVLSLIPAVNEYRAALSIVFVQGEAELSLPPQITSCISSTAFYNSPKPNLTETLAQTFILTRREIFVCSIFTSEGLTEMQKQC